MRNFQACERGRRFRWHDAHELGNDHRHRDRRRRHLRAVARAQSAPARHRLPTSMSAPPQIKELGVGITLLPHAHARIRRARPRGRSSRRRASRIARAASSTASASSSTRSRAASSPGYDYPGSRHPSRPAASDALSTRRASGSAPTAIVTDHDCVGVEQDEDGVDAAHLRETSTGAPSRRARRRVDRLRRHQFGDPQAASTRTSSSPSPASTPGAA